MVEFQSKGLVVFFFFFLMYPILGSTRIVPSLHKRRAEDRGNLSPLNWLWADWPPGPSPRA